MSPNEAISISLQVQVAWLAFAYLVFLVLLRMSTVMVLWIQREKSYLFLSVISIFLDFAVVGMLYSFILYKYPIECIETALKANLRFGGI
jgi:hypothetical protein